MNSVEARAIVEQIEEYEQRIASLYELALDHGGPEGKAAVHAAVAFRKQSRMAFNGQQSVSAWEWSEWKLRELDTE